MIPWYLIVGGCLTIILVLGRFIWQLVRMFMLVLIRYNNSAQACLRCNTDRERDKGGKLACLACQFSCLAL